MEKILKLVSKWLVAIGALNWGLFSLFKFNIVESLLPSFSMIIYSIIGVAGAYMLIQLIMGKD